MASAAGAVAAAVEAASGAGEAVGAEFASYCRAGVQLLPYSRLSGQGVAFARPRVLIWHQAWSHSCADARAARLLVRSAVVSRIADLAASRVFPALDLSVPAGTRQRQVQAQRRYTEGWLCRFPRERCPCGGLDHGVSAIAVARSRNWGAACAAAPAAGGTTALLGWPGVWERNRSQAPATAVCDLLWLRDNRRQPTNDRLFVQPCLDPPTCLCYLSTGWQQ